MKRYFNRILSFIIATNIFLSYSITSYAFPARLKDGTWIDKPWAEAGEEIWQTILYGMHQIGVFFVNGADFEQWLKNTEAYQDLWDENGRLAKYTSIDTKTGNVIYKKEIMSVFKSAADEYAKTEQTKEENGGFYILPTTDFTKVPVDKFYSSQQYRTFRNIIAEKGCLPVGTSYYYRLRFFDPFSDPDHPMCLVFDPEYYNHFIENPEVEVNCMLFCLNCWKKHSYPRMEFEKTDQIYTSISDAIWEENYGYRNNAKVNSKEGDSWNFTLYSTTGENIRVFISELAAKNYSAGKRKVYFTKNYYNYVPEDLTVSIDDLQKSVSDLEKIIEELLKKINDKTSENDIEDLLRQILDELRNSGGGGGGSGSGDVTVNVDLKETNSWLSKIYSKVSQIFEKMNSAVKDAEDAALAKIQESLDEIIVQLKKIKHWAAVDTVIDGVDAIADWLDLIRGVISDGEEGVGTAVTTVAESLADSADSLSKKFPFSIPWDILFFISVFAAEPQVPYFEIPMDIDMDWLDINIHYDFVIDFSQFQWFSDLSRLILSMTYAVGLLKLTMNIALLKKED